MARILVLCFRTPYPLTDGARVRAFHTADLLSREHTVELLITARGGADDEAVAELRSRFAAVHTFDLSPLRSYANAVRGLFSRDPIQSHYFSLGSVDDWLDRNENRFDLLYGYHPRMAPYVCGREPATIVDLVDATSLNYERSAPLADGFDRLLYTVEAKRLARYERALVDRCDHTFITTAADRRHVDPGVTAEEFSVFTNGVDEELLRAETSPPDAVESPSVVFVGSMDYFPNVDAVVAFAEEVFPTVREEFPDATFEIVGASPADRVQELAAADGVVVTGFVDDPTEYLRTADLVVAPLRAGAGIQNKVLEGMAAGRPVVATEVAAEGISADHGSEFAVAPFGDAYVDEVLRLLGAPDRRVEIGRRGRDYVQQNHTWEAVADQLIKPVRATLQSSD